MARSPIAQVADFLFIPQRVDIPQADADLRQDPADLAQGIGRDILGVTEDQQVGMDVAAGFNQRLVGAALAEGLALDRREHPRTIIDRERIDEMPQPNQAVVDLLVLVPQVRPVLVELEIGRVDDAHGGSVELKA